jgi:hypothetical protein
MSINVEEKLKELLKESYEEVKDGEDWIEVRMPGGKDFKCKKLVFCAGAVEGHDSIWMGGVAGRVAVGDLMQSTKVIEKSVKEVLDVMIKEQPLAVLKEMMEMGDELGKKKEVEALEALKILLEKMGK